MENPTITMYIYLTNSWTRVTTNYWKETTVTLAYSGNAVFVYFFVFIGKKFSIVTQSGH